MCLWSGSDGEVQDHSLETGTTAAFVKDLAAYTGHSLPECSAQVAITTVTRRKWDWRWGLCGLRMEKRGWDLGGAILVSEEGPCVGWGLSLCWPAVPGHHRVG